MLNAPETTKTTTVPSAQVSESATHGQRKSDSPASTICDLAEANAFCEGFGKPHVPVSVVFGGVCRLNGSWDLDRMVSENADALFRSIRKLPSKDGKNAPVDRDDLTFQFGPRAFLYADANRIVGFASAPADAERLVTQFSKTYLKPPTPAGGEFRLIQQDRTEISCHCVSLPPETILSTEALGLHYCSGSAEWHQHFVGKLRERIHGLAIFEGKPGTGKTCYLRHLMGVLKESHRFFFIPTATLSVLSIPEFISFWASQRRIHASQKFVVILEDSDAALMTRGSDNREQVSAILNLSDGMLADFLRLQIICTINCSAADIDPALLRPNDCFAIGSLAGSTTRRRPGLPGVSAGNCRWPVIIPSRKCLPDMKPMKSTARASALQHKTMKITDCDHYRQGDVLIERIAIIPTNAVQQNKSARIILAHGEVTGHHHTLATADSIDWWKAGAISTANQKPATLAGEVYVSLPSGGVVTHQEHSEISLPVGNYRITRQHEYSPDALRNVAD